MSLGRSLDLNSASLLLCFRINSGLWAHDQIVMIFKVAERKQNVDTAASPTKGACYGCGRVAYYVIEMQHASDYG